MKHSIIYMVLLTLGMSDTYVWAQDVWPANGKYDPSVPLLTDDQTVTPRELLYLQEREIKAGVRQYDPTFMPKILTQDELEAAARKAVEDAVQPTLKKLSKEVLSKVESVNWPKPDRFDEIPVPTIVPRTDLQTKTFKDWRAKYGDNKTMLAEAYASFHMSGNKEFTQADVNAWGEIGIFGSTPFRILSAHGIVQAPHRGVMKLEGQIWIGGHTLMNETLDLPSIERSDTREETILNVEQKFRFSVGPVPMSAKLGAQGKSGFSYGFRASPLHASAFIRPSIKANAFVEVAVDVEVAAAGAGGSLVLCDASSELRAIAEVNFDSRGDFNLLTSLTSNAALRMLEGHLYGFVELNLLLEKKRWEKELYRWNGIQQEFGNTVNFKKMTTASSIAVEGDADDEDFVATDFDRYERDLADGIHAELVAAAPKVDGAVKQSLASLQVLRDKDLKDFWDRYARP